MKDRLFQDQDMNSSIISESQNFFKSESQSSKDLDKACNFSEQNED